MDKVNKEKLHYKYQKLAKLCNTAERALTLYATRYNTASDIEQETYSASVIKHFELFYELLWKYLKLFLLYTYGTEATGSKIIFRSCAHHKIINQNELENLLKTVQIRNTTSHVYDEEMAQEICQEIKEHFTVMKDLINRAKPSLQK